MSSFCSVTGASPKEAKKFLEKHKRLDVAVDAYFHESAGRRQSGGASSASSSKLTALFDKYKESDGEDISIDGTILLCQDLDVNPEDVVLLCVAYELKSKRMGTWTRKEWIDGWKALGYVYSCHSCPFVAASTSILQPCLHALTHQSAATPYPP
ncbi:hypothetical protein CPB85DRAFT_476917 [Mucidula mucida]|nr:hypothetical protein CPB85DRAFT_476917 [Mucidula mucida]